MYEFDEKTIRATKTWLGDEGCKHFQDLIDQHGPEWYVSCYLDKIIPHPIHFREGMQVRNFMRQTLNSSQINDDHFLDNNWHHLIEQCLQSDIEPAKPSQSTKLQFIAGRQ